MYSTGYELRCTDHGDRVHLLLHPFLTKEAELLPFFPSSEHQPIFS